MGRIHFCMLWGQSMNCCIILQAGAPLFLTLGRLCQLRRLQQWKQLHRLKPRVSICPAFCMLMLACTYFLTSLTQIPKDLVSETPSTCTSIESITCFPVTISENLPPKLDGYADEWEFVEVFETPLAGVLNAQRQYPHGNGNVQIQCVYDTEKVYFLFHVPGPYRSSTEVNRKNAAMSMVFKMGEMATLPDMVSALPTYE